MSGVDTEGGGMSEIYKKNPAHVLAHIAKARGEPVDDGAIERLAAYCDEPIAVDDDDLSAYRGILCGIVLGALVWAVGLLIWWVL